MDCLQTVGGSGSQAARHVSNQFEWLMHAPLARKAGVEPSVLDDIAAGRHPRCMQPDEAAAFDVATELLLRNGVSDASFDAATALFGEQGMVELVTLVGYFTMVSWVMNAARTPASGEGAALAAFPA